MVIGSGAGGAPVAWALAEAGLEVVVLEAGERLATRDFAGDEGALLARLMTATTVADGGLELYAGATVGGSTVVNDALCWQPPPEIFDDWRREHRLVGLTEAAFAPHVERVWTRIHAAPTERENRNRNSRLLERGAARLGWSGEAMARNVRGCVNLGRCNSGCPSGAKQSALSTWLPDAEAYAVTEFRDVHGGTGPGYMLENVTTGPATTAGGLPGFGVAHEEAMAVLPHLARVVVVLRDATRGSVALGRDGAPVFSYVPVARDLDRLRSAVRACARVYLAASASEVHVPVNGLGPIRTEAGLDALDAAAFDARSLSQLYAVHLFGGACMSGSRADGFCDESGRAFDVAGLYVTDASSLPSNTGVNPQVTIQANALRIAEAIPVSSRAARSASPGSELARP